MISNKQEAENLYRQLGRLIEVVPDLTAQGPITQELNLWLARAYALVESVGNVADMVNLKTHISRLNTAARNQAAQEIHAIIYRALAVAELQSPAGASGTFIPVGNSFDAFSAISKLLQSAKKDVLILDPYMDETTLTEFATALPENINLRLMADENDHKPPLIPAAAKWSQQYNAKRPLALRLAPARSLHDRAIFIDGTTAYTLTQSLKDIAKRSPAEIIRADDTATLKIAAYELIWQKAKVIL